MKGRNVVFYIAFIILVGLFAGVLKYFYSESERNTVDLLDGAPAYSPNKHENIKNRPDYDKSVAHSPSTGNGIKDLVPSVVISNDEMKKEIDALVSSQSFEKALELVEKYLSMDITSETRERILQYKGNLLLATGKVEDAYTVYWNILHDGVRNDVRGWATVKLYVAAKQLDKIDALIAEIEQLVGTDSDNVRLKQSLADIYAYAGQTDREINLRLQFFEMEPTDIENGRKLIAAYQKTGDYLSVADISGQMAKTDIEQETYHLVRQAKSLIKAKSVDDAQAVCDQIYNSPRANAQTLLWSGYLYEQLGQLKEAESAFEKGAEHAVEQYRKERCLVEACKIRTGQGIFVADDRALVEDMAENARATGVRKLAKQILTENE